ncbi:hypothetical protein [Limnoglobus roseus]|uniref:Uncharacterized protein n=1 Tax=Limnoglobus roseus TaxID=2598579 RepID=A0A5C1A756_9BACT|nr:hypothetical protein [Limnoglobus roseus]QEL14017.1 hypothetical protein PX52LOC_00879 [Limnoglobus roseus]
MGRARATRRWLLVALGVVLALGLAAAARPEPTVQVNRPRSLRHRVECVLEAWGVIPVDPFRHVEG